MKQKVSKEFKAMNKFLKFSLLEEMNPNSLRSNSGFESDCPKLNFLTKLIQGQNKKATYNGNYQK